MARMFPERPRATSPDSERRVFNELKATLDDEFVVFHSVAWHGRRGKPDGEVDFLVAHPNGLLVLEVKGGGIGFEATTASWFSIDRHGERFQISDPFTQALTGKHQLIAEIRADPRWPDGRPCQIGYAVVLPNVPIAADGFTQRGKREITFGSNDLATLGVGIRECLRYWHELEPAPAPRADGMKALIAMYGTSRLYRVPLSQTVADDEERIIELTEEQFEILAQLARHRRAAITGCAGSGKTLLAVEKARRLAESGQKVLLTCFNKTLAEYLRATRPLPPNLDVVHFHGLCEEFVEAAGMRGDRPIDVPYYEWLPGAMLEAFQHVGRRYDGVIIDEGQDFKSDWFELLELCLDDVRGGEFYVFSDDNQRLYSNDALPDWLGPPYQLTKNVRNSNQVGRLVESFYKGPPVRLSGIDGRTVKLVIYEDEASAPVRYEELRAVLDGLRKEGAQPQSVTVLTAQRRTDLWQRREFGEWVLYGRDHTDGNVLLETIHSFKGQDNAIVVLCELEGSASNGNDNLEALLYVGCSRARHVLIVLASETLGASLRERIAP